MRKWWKTLGLLTGSLLGLAVTFSLTFAQPPSPGGGGPPPEKDPFSMKDDGAPNAFSDLFGIRARQNEGVLPGPPLGIFRRRPTLGSPAEFPNPATCSSEEASPFSMQEGGQPNGFTELKAAGPSGPLARIFGRSRILYTELLEQPNYVGQCYTLTFRAEALRWRLSNGPLSVPLVTTTANPTLATFGQLDDPNTQILVPSGTNAIDYGGVGGFRFSMGLAAIHYFPPIEVSGFLINKTVSVFSEGSFTNPARLLAIPFQDVQPAFIIPGTNFGIETAAVIAIPINSGVGGQGGSIDISSTLSFWGIDANVFLPLGESDVMKWDVSIGYRHLQLNETLGISAVSGNQIGSIFFNSFLLPQGFTNSTFDSFSTKNRFDGFQAGLRGIFAIKRWSLYTDLKIALGRSSQELDIAGSSTLIQSVAGRPTQTTTGGLFALPSNSGTFSSSPFSVATEVNFALSYQLHRNIRIYGGYDLLNWNKVVRPGDYINNIIDSRQIPTGANFAPNATFNGPGQPSLVSHGFVAQGLFFGFEIGF